MVLVTTRTWLFQRKCEWSALLSNSRRFRVFRASVVNSWEAAGEVAEAPSGGA